MLQTLRADAVCLRRLEPTARRLPRVPGDAESGAFGSASDSALTRPACKTAAGPFRRTLRNLVQPVAGRRSWIRRGWFLEKYRLPLRRDRRGILALRASIGAGLLVPASQKNCQRPCLPHPPLTGGMIASSSPSFSAVPSGTYAWFTAYADRASNFATAGIRSPRAATAAAAVAPDGRSSASSLVWAVSRSTANNLTITRIS